MVVRVLAGWLLRPSVDRRMAFAVNAAMQATAVLLLLVATGQATHPFAPAAFGLLQEIDTLAMFAAVAGFQALSAALVLAGRRS